MWQALSTGASILVSGISLPFVGAPEFVRGKEYMDCRYQNLPCGYGVVLL